jgi:AcrR family transcriptional regulator
MMPGQGGTTRRTQEQRRRETQEAVLSAALQVLIEGGFVKFTASGVAARARVSRGALEHYFPTRNDLLAAATQYAMDKAVEHAARLAARATRSADPVGKFLLDSEHFFFSPVYRAMIELAIAASNDRSLSRAFRPIVTGAREVLDGIWIDTLDAAGYPRENAQRFIDLTHFLLRGVFLASAWLPYKTDRRALMEMWLTLAPAVLGLEPASARALRKRDAPRKAAGRRTGRVPSVA